MVTGLFLFCAELVFFCFSNTGVDCALGKLRVFEELNHSNYFNELIFGSYIGHELVAELTGGIGYLRNCGY